MYHISRYHYFFFQAVDGIRDGTVTGVQTCALPISIPHTRRDPYRDGPGPVLDAGAAAVHARVVDDRARSSAVLARLAESERTLVAADDAGSVAVRSEERRVGIVCRMRRAWWLQQTS